MRSPERTLVVSPDNESRREINSAVHQAMQADGKVSNEEHRVHVLYARQDITGSPRRTMTKAMFFATRKEANL